MELIAQILERHAKQFPAKAAVVASKQVFSYSRLLSLAHSAAQWLCEQGLLPGDRAVVIVPAGDPWFVVAYLGMQLARVVAVPVDADRPAAVRQTIRDLVEPGFTLDESAFNRLKAHLEQCSDVVDAARIPQPAAAPDDTAEILFTSGTTGTPKGVVLTNRNILASTRNIVEFVGNTADDREIVTVPLSHSFGLGRLRSILYAGGTAVLVPGLRFPAVVFRDMALHEATGMSCVPSGLALLVRVAGSRFGELAGSLRYMELGSERMDPDSRRELMHALPATRICMHYGLTEASRSAFLAFHDDADRLDSVGRSTPNVSISVRATDGRCLPPNVTGRICVQADTVMSGYWRDAPLTRSRIDGAGWFDTGDVGYLDEAGYLHLRGRADDVINVGGRKVYPVAVEEAAVQFSGVREAACVAAADHAGLVSEVPVLFVVPEADTAPDVEALLQFLGRSLERHAVPRDVHFIDTLPRTESGKLKRASLRAGLPPSSST